MVLIGEGPIFALSPVTQRIFFIPRLFIPITDDCNPVLVVSRAAICRTGSAPLSKAVLQHARLDIRGRADEESVKLIADTQGFTEAISFISFFVFELKGGVISVAMTNFPSRSLASSPDTGSLYAGL